MDTSAKLQTSLRLFKDSFKFSSAHFLIFDSQSAEKLHGHNYQVQVEIDFSNSGTLTAAGYHADFRALKQIIKATVDEWDEHVLLPKAHPEMKFKILSPSLEVRFRERLYVFPENEVILLDVQNTSVEHLSQILARKLLDRCSNLRVKGVRVSVEETRGQAAVTEARI